MDEDREFKRARNSAMRLLGVRDRSCFELKERLKKKEFPEAVSDRVIAWLLEYNYLNDERFAFAFARSRVENKRFGQFRVRRELSLKGIAGDLIDRVLAEVYEQNDPDTLARAAAEKKMSGWNGLPAQTVRRRMAGFLKRQGFSGDVVYRTLDALVPSRFSGSGDSGFEES